MPIVQCLKLILIHYTMCSSYRKNTPPHRLILHQNLTKTTSLHLVHSTDQQCMKLESSELHTITEQNSVWAAVQLS